MARHNKGQGIGVAALTHRPGSTGVLLGSGQLSMCFCFPEWNQRSIRKVKRIFRRGLRKFFDMHRAHLVCCACVEVYFLVFLWWEKQ